MPPSAHSVFLVRVRLFGAPAPSLSLGRTAEFPGVAHSDNAIPLGRARSARPGWDAFFISLLMALLLTAVVQTGAPATLTGLVVDTNRQPIEGVVIAATPSNPRFDEPVPSATSDANGRFSIEAMGRPPFTVAAHAPGFEPFRQRDVTLEAPLRIVLEQAAVSLTGRVVDGDTQEPIAGARVESRAVAAGRLDDHPRFGLVEVATDDEGRFALSGLGAGPFRVSASAPRYGSATRNDVAGDAAVTLYLFRGVGIYGRVLDEKGEPVEGAFVDAESTNRGFFGRGSPGAVQRSDSEGRFAILGLEAGRYHVYARHPDFAPAAYEATLSDHDIEIDLTLGKGSRVTGRLIDANDQPLSGRAVVEALDGSPVGRLIESSLSAETDTDGAFVIKDVPRGEHRLRLSARGYGSDSADVYVGSEAVVDIGDVVLQIGLAIHGVVVDTSGAPVAGARIQAFASGLRRASHRPEQEDADAQGRFVLAGLEQGLYRVLAHAQGYASEFVEAEAGRGTAPITVTLKAAGTIRGSVIDPEGQPIGAFRVMARSPEQRGFGGMATGSAQDNGVFLVENVAEGTYAVEVSASDFVSKVLSDVSVTPGSVTDVGTVRMERGARLRGVVTDTAGAPVPGATVKVRTPGQRFMSPFDSGEATDASGRFEIDGLSEGKVDVIASHPSYADGRLEGVAIDRRFTNDVELVLQMGGALEGYVRSRDGTDVAGRSVLVGAPRPRRSMPPERNSVQTGPDGYFRFDHLESGTREVALMASSGAVTFAVQVREVEIRDHETAFVEFDSRRILVQGQVRRRGSPVASAEVDLRPVEAGFSVYGGARAAEAIPEGPRFLNGVTGDDGYFELLVDAPGEYRASVSVSGTGLPSRSVVVPDLETFVLDLDFGGVSISGRVFDRDTEKPITGAFVSARPDPPNDAPSGGYMRTGADGTFELELELEPGTFKLMAGAEGYASETRNIRVGQAGVAGLDVSLASGLRISGRVVGQNGRAAIARVYAIEDVPDLNTPPMGMAVNFSLADGTFLLNELSRGRYNLLAGDELQGFGFAAGVPTGTEDVEIVLRPGGSLDVVVVDREGAPVAKAAVAIVGIGGRKVRGIQTGTDAEGRATLAVPSGNLHVKAAKRDAQLEGMTSVSVQSGGRGAARIVVAPVPTAR